MNAKALHQNRWIDFPIERSVHPESLAVIRELCEKDDSPFYPLFQNLFQMQIILDTNVIISDLLWMATKRKSPDVAPCLLNILVCGTLKAYAPKFLLEELDKHLPRLSEERGVPLDVLMEYWKEYEPYIDLVEVEEPAPEEKALAQDPKDLPYIQVQKKIGAKIYTNDSDISAMNGDVAGRAVIISLGEYSQQVAVEYTIKFIGLSSVTITYAMVAGVVELIKALTKQSQKLPGWALGAAGLMVVLAAAHPESRRAIMSWFKKFPKERFLDICLALMELSVALTDKHYEAQERAQEILGRIEG